MLTLLIAIVLAHVDHPEIIPVLRCESGLTQYKEDGSLLTGKDGEIGIAQFMPATWKKLNEERGTKLDIENPIAQINMMDWAFGRGYQDKWTCWRANK